MSTPDFFRSRLDQMIDLKHPLAVLSKRLPWAAIEAAVAPKLARDARPAKQLRGEDLAGAKKVRRAHRQFPQKSALRSIEFRG